MLLVSTLTPLPADEEKLEHLILHGNLSSPGSPAIDQSREYIPASTSMAEKKPRTAPAIATRPAQW
jgi:hypothetical protein